MATSKALFLGGALLLAVGTAFVVGSVIRTRQQAVMVIDELKALSVSSRPNDTFDSFQWKYGRNRFKHSEACTFHDCTYEINISNDLLAKLHLAPYTEMRTWFTVDKGQLIFAMLEYRTALKGPHSPVVHVQQGMCPHGCGVRFDVNPHRINEQTWNGLVEFNPRATPAEKDAALALNIDCFHRLRGCKDIVDLLPAIWERGGPYSVSSRFAGLSQRLEESHSFPSPDDF